MRYLMAQELLVLHALVIEETGGSDGVRDVSLVASAVAKPQTSFGGKELYSGIFLKAAVLLEAVVNYHAFVDGNKRTGFVATARFLSLNGYTFSGSNKDVEKTVLLIATKEMQVRNIAVWLKKNSKKNSKI